MPPARARTISGDDARVSQPTAIEMGGPISAATSAGRGTAPIRETVSSSRGGAPASPRMPSVPKSVRIPRAMLRECGPARPAERSQEAQRLGHVVDADEEGPPRREVRGDGDGGEGLRQAVVRGRSGDRPEERLARRPDDEGNFGRREAIERAEK